MQVKVLKPFNNGDGAQAPYVRKGEMIEVDDSRGKALERSGLVEIVAKSEKPAPAEGEKQAPAPANKMKALPRNKAGAKGAKPAPAEAGEQG